MSRVTILTVTSLSSLIITITITDHPRVCSQLISPVSHISMSWSGAGLRVQGARPGAEPRHGQWSVVTPARHLTPAASSTSTRRGRWLGEAGGWPGPVLGPWSSVTPGPDQGTLSTAAQHRPQPGTGRQRRHRRR